MSYQSLNMFAGRIEKELNKTLESGRYNKEYVLTMTMTLHFLKALKRFY